MLSNEAIFRTVIDQILVFTIHEENYVEITQHSPQSENPVILELRNKALWQPEVNREEKLDF